MVALWLQLTKLTTTCEIALSFLLLQLADVDVSDVVMYNCPYKNCFSQAPGLKNKTIRLRAQLQNIQDDPEQLGEEPILPPFTPNPMPADQSVIKDYSPFRPVARSPVAQPLVLELDMDSEDISDDTTEPDSNETHLYEYETDQDF